MTTPAELQITNLIYRYAHHVDQAEFDKASDLFRRAVVVQAGEEKDSAGLLDSFRNAVQLYDGHPRTHHLMHNIIIDFNDDQTAAKVETKYTVFQGLEGRIWPVITGGYHDEFAADNGEWYFTRREYWIGLGGDLSKHLTFDPIARQPE